MDVSIKVIITHYNLFLSFKENPQPGNVIILSYRLDLKQKNQQQNDDDDSAYRQIDPTIRYGKFLFDGTGLLTQLSFFIETKRGFIHCFDLVQAGYQ